MSVEHFEFKPHLSSFQTSPELKLNIKAVEHPDSDAGKMLEDRRHTQWEDLPGVSRVVSSSPTSVLLVVSSY